MRMCKIMYLNSFYNIVACNVNVILFQHFSQHSSKKGGSGVQGLCADGGRRKGKGKERGREGKEEGRQSLAWDPSHVDIACGKGMSTLFSGGDLSKCSAQCTYASCCSLCSRAGTRFKSQRRVWKYLHTQAPDTGGQQTVIKLVPRSSKLV